MLPPVYPSLRLGGSGEGDGGLDGDGGGASGGGDEGGDPLQAAASSRPRELVSSAIFCARSASDESVAICSSVAKLNLFPKPHANTVTPSPLTSAAASTAVSNSVSVSYTHLTLPTTAYV